MEDVPYGRILREGWLIMVIAALLGGAVAYGVAKLLPETYTASSTLLLQVESNEASLFERNQFSLARIKTYPALVDSPEVVDGVRADLDLSVEAYSDRDIRRMLTAENATDTVLLTIRAEAPTAAMAAGMADSAAGHLSELIDATENSSDDRYDVSLDQVIPAVEPVSPSSPQVLAITGLGLIGGLAAGAIFAVYRTTASRRLRTISDVRQAAGLPVVGRIPRPARLTRGPAQNQPEGTDAAAYEDAINNLFTLGGAAVSRFVVVPVSAGSVDDAVLRGLIAAFAATGRRACVLDLRSGAEHAADARPLSELLPGGVAPAAHSRSPGSPTASDVYAVTTDTPMSTLEGEVAGLVLGLALDFDIVMVVPPPTASALVEATSRTGAGVVLAVRHNSTSATDLVAITARLRIMGVRPLGVLMTHGGPRDVGVAAESWRDSDRVEVVAAGAAESHGTGGSEPRGSGDDRLSAAPAEDPITTSAEKGVVPNAAATDPGSSGVGPASAADVDAARDVGDAAPAQVSYRGGRSGRAAR